MMLATKKDSLMRLLIGLLLGGVVFSQLLMYVGGGRTKASAASPFYFDLRLPSEEKPVYKEMVGLLLIDAIIQIESGGNPKTVGSKGERGLMQIMPLTWRDMTRDNFDGPVSFDDAFDPELNRQVGRAYLNFLKQRLYKNRGAWNADLRSLLLASYNAGPKAVSKANYTISRLPKSVQSYVWRGSALHDALLNQRLEEAEAKASSFFGLL